MTKRAFDKIAAGLTDALEHARTPFEATQGSEQMTVFNMPEGVELALKVYLVGLVEEREVEIVITVGGLPAFTDSVLDHVDLDSIVKSNNLNDLGTGWRIMTRPEVADYKERERADEEFAAP